MSHSLIHKTFKSVKKENRPALLTYTVAGEPNKKKSFEKKDSIMISEKPKSINIDIYTGENPDTYIIDPNILNFTLVSDKEKTLYDSKNLGEIILFKRGCKSR